MLFRNGFFQSRPGFFYIKFHRKMVNSRISFWNIVFVITTFSAPAFNRPIQGSFVLFSPYSGSLLDNFLRLLSLIILKLPAKVCSWCWSMIVILEQSYMYTLLEKCPNTEFFLVCIFLYSDWIQRFEEQISIFSPNLGKYGPERTPHLDIFHAI